MSLARGHPSPPDLPRPPGEPTLACRGTRAFGLDSRPGPAHTTGGCFPSLLCPGRHGRRSRPPAEGRRRRSGGFPLPGASLGGHRRTAVRAGGAIPWTKEGRFPAAGPGIRRRPTTRTPQIPGSLGPRREPGICSPPSGLARTPWRERESMRREVDGTGASASPWGRGLADPVTARCPRERAPNPPRWSRRGGWWWSRSPGRTCLVRPPERSIRPGVPSAPGRCPRPRPPRWRRRSSGRAPPSPPWGMRNTWFTSPRTRPVRVPAATPPWNGSSHIPLPTAAAAPPAPHIEPPAAAPAPDARLRRRFRQLCDRTQRLLARAEPDRRDFWRKAHRRDPAPWAETRRPQRRRMHADLIGRCPEPSVPARPRTRPVYDRPGWQP